jgi:hypothetical protein
MSTVPLECSYVYICNFRIFRIAKYVFSKPRKLMCERHLATNISEHDVLAGLSENRRSLALSVAKYKFDKMREKTKGGE